MKEKSLQYFCYLAPIPVISWSSPTFSDQMCNSKQMKMLMKNMKPPLELFLNVILFFQKQSDPSVWKQNVMRQLDVMCLFICNKVLLYFHMEKLIFTEVYTTTAFYQKYLNAVMYQWNGHTLYPFNQSCENKILAK